MDKNELVNQRYIGDGVYVGVNAHTDLVWLYTYNGLKITNEIALEPEVIDQFKHWLEWNTDQKSKIS